MPKGQPGTMMHGLSGYNHWHCRCEVCSEAKREYRRARRARGAETNEDWRRWKNAWRARTGLH